MSKKKQIDREVPPEHPEDYRDPDCPRCDAIHYSVFDFNFAGEWRLEALLYLAASHPEIIERCEDEINPN